jgi:predicted lactoylglutathione lyase
MIGYCLVGTKDLERAAAFYDEVFSLLGVARCLTWPGRMVTWGAMWKEPHFGVATPFNQQSATVGNGTMIALKADQRQLVDQVYRKALELGGTDEGLPGVRGGDSNGFYGAYFRDLDANKLCIFRYGPTG